MHPLLGAKCLGIDEQIFNTRAEHYLKKATTIPFLKLEELFRFYFPFHSLAKKEKGKVQILLFVSHIFQDECKLFGLFFLVCLEKCVHIKLFC